MFAPHQTQPTIGTAATLHFTACFVREDRAQEYDINSKRAILNRFIHPPLEPKDGYLPVPACPGLGLEVNVARLLYTSLDPKEDHVEAQTCPGRGGWRPVPRNAGGTR